jgi:hypothetical protein
LSDSVGSPPTVRVQRPDANNEPPHGARRAPAAIDGLHTVIDHALNTYQRTRDPDSICEAFRTLTNELARTPSKRDRFEMARR